MPHFANFNPGRGTVARAFLLLLLTLAPAAAQDEGKRVALIIGNNNYSMSPLRNAVSDARLMERALQAAGFRTILRLDAGLTAMDEAVGEFVSQLGPDDTALFFYAGHGVQINSENFLVPVDFQAAGTITQAKFRCFRVASLLDELKNRPKRSIVVLDACRSNPVAASNSLEAGLAQPQSTGKETYIAFSTGPGQVAADNPTGRNSWFTDALAELIDQPGLTLDDVFTRVKSRVSSETERRQSPWTISSLTSTFYFHAPSNLKAENDPSLAEKWMVEAQRREQRQEWGRAIELLGQVINRKPGGALEAGASAKLPYLEARKAAKARYDAGDYTEAAGLFEKALALDTFAIDAAFEAARSYLLSDQLPEAVKLLSGVRTRGASVSLEKANTMLKELAAVYPEAGQALAGGIPAPPSIQELFRTVNFDTPDWNAGIRLIQSAPIPVTRWIKALETAYPAPPEPVEISTNGAPAPAEAAQSTASSAKDFFHIEVSPTGESRDISIRKIGEKDGPFGVLMLNGSPAQTFVMVNGAVVAQALPYPLRLPPGKYEIRGVQHGQVLNRQDVEIGATETKTVTIRGGK